MRHQARETGRHAKTRGALAHSGRGIYGTDPFVVINTGPPPSPPSKLGPLDGGLFNTFDSLSSSAFSRRHIAFEGSGRDV